MRKAIASAIGGPRIGPPGRLDSAPPPGEMGRELSGSAGIAALHHALQDFTGPAKLAFSVKSITPKKFARWVVIKVVFAADVAIDGKVVNEVSVRMPRARAESLRLALTRELGK